MATEIGLAIGAVVGGGVGAGIADAAVGTGYHLAKEKWQMAWKILEYYAETLTYVPKMCNYLKKWAEIQIYCKNVVAGIDREELSTVAAALTGIPPEGEAVVSTGNK